MPTSSSTADLSDLSAARADSDPWSEQFEIAADAGMELGDLLAEHGAIDKATMQRLTELHEELEDAEDIDEGDELTEEASRIVMSLLPAVWRMIVSPERGWSSPPTEQDDLRDAREAGFVTGFITAVASTVLAGSASSRRERPGG
ncbi:MAG: hypothetical protein O9972_14300, partial [Burkholderiales bacterium]|nr:hypothetical protein [Burkholderiales bacterium]